jgi:hypothetical protein
MLKTATPPIVIVKTEQEILADIYANVRRFTRNQLHQLKEVDLTLRPVINGKTFNSVYWIAAHLAWTEDYLLHRALTGKSSAIEWLHDYRQTSKPEDATRFPSYNEILHTLDELHAIALHNIKSMSTTDMEKINNVQDDYLGQTIKRQIIYNAIQHEPMHCGHLSWLMKVHGLKTI